MATKIDTAHTLARSATRAAEFRGHVLGSFDWKFSDSKITGIAACSDCAAWVRVDTRPAPNGIDVGGPAVAIGCSEGGK